jgi:hypothetical protein
MIKMGCKARDRVTGMEGILTSRLTKLDGGVQWGLQPPVASEKPAVYPDGMNIDETQLEFIDDGLSDVAVPPLLPPSIKMGEAVADQITGFAGIVTEITQFMNGCVYLTVQGENTAKKNEVPFKIFAQHFRFKKTGAGITRLIPASKMTKKPAPPGGPVTRMLRA